MDAKNIKHLLLNNSTLELLDLHCNELNDDSLQHICEGLAEQPGTILVQSSNLGLFYRSNLEFGIVFSKRSRSLSAWN